MSDSLGLDDHSHVINAHFCIITKTPQVPLYYIDTPGHIIITIPPLKLTIGLGITLIHLILLQILFISWMRIDPWKTMVATYASMDL